MKGVGMKRSKEVKNKSPLQLSQRKYKLKKKAEGAYNRGDRAAQTRRYYKAREAARKAHRFVEKAIKKGWLIRPRVCSICSIKRDKQAIYAHHEDYAKPAEVVWVCWLCHNNLHNEEVI